MSKENLFVLAFNTTSHCIQAEKAVKPHFAVAIIPTPRELTNDCGLAIKFLAGAQKQDILAFVATLTIPCELYLLGDKDADGLRQVNKVFSNIS